jgi:hypothetical protein
MPRKSRPGEYLFTARILPAYTRSLGDSLRNVAEVIWTAVGLIWGVAKHGKRPGPFGMARTSGPAEVLCSRPEPCPVARHASIDLERAMASTGLTPDDIAPQDLGGIWIPMLGILVGLAGPESLILVIVPVSIRRLTF